MRNKIVASNVACYVIYRSIKKENGSITAWGSDPPGTMLMIRGSSVQSRLAKGMPMGQAVPHLDNLTASAKPATDTSFSNVAAFLF